MTRRKPVRQKHLQLLPVPTAVHTMAPHTRVSRDRRAIKANISTLAGEVINTLPALLLVYGASRDIILNKAMANSSNIGSSESFKRKTCF